MSVYIVMMRDPGITMTLQQHCTMILIRLTTTIQRPRRTFIGVRYFRADQNASCSEINEKTDF